jgi:hypothetical protein
MWDLPAHPERFVVRLATGGPVPSPYLLLADGLAGVQELLPPGLVWSERQPGDIPEGVEIWFAQQPRGCTARSPEICSSDCTFKIIWQSP